MEIYVWRWGRHGQIVRDKTDRPTPRGEGVPTMGTGFPYSVTQGVPMMETVSMATGVRISYISLASAHGWVATMSSGAVRREHNVTLQ